MKKSQLIGRPLMYSLFTLVAIFILIFGAQVIVSWTSQSKQMQLIHFLNSLQNVIKKHSIASFGSVDEKTVALPSEIETLCLVDKSKNISPLINSGLNGEINKFHDKNTFFEPFDKFNPMRINDFELNKDENPLCLKTIKSTVKLSLTSKGGKTLVSTFRPDEKKVDCVSVLYNSPPNGSIDIVFLGYGYEKFDDFRDDVSKKINVFLDTEPFKSNKEKINFYRIDKFGGFGCEIGSWAQCDEFEVKKLASYCPNDYIIVLIDRSKIKDLLNPVRSSAISNMEKINTADNDLVILHEFGHIFGGLADEYVDEKYYSNMNFNEEDYPNCDSPECSKWGSVNGTGCFDGCSLKKYSRSTPNSVMRSLNTEKFGPLNEMILINKLNFYGER